MLCRPEFYGVLHFAVLCCVLCCAVCCGAQVWDKDVVTDDDVIGRTSWSFSPQEVHGTECGIGALPVSAHVRKAHSATVTVPATAAQWDRA
jgi:hypothetical protein